jgi:hypothetical protein
MGVPGIGRGPPVTASKKIRIAFAGVALALIFWVITHRPFRYGEEEFYVVLGNSIYEHLATAPPVFRSSTPGSRSTHLNILTTREKQNANLQAGRAKPSVFDNYTVHFFDPELNQQCTTDAFRATRV